MRNMLNRKLFRDMWHNRMQFLAMILLLALGTWIFGGLDSAWRMLDVSIDYYFVQQNMTDYWVKMSPLEKDTRIRIQNIEGVKDVQIRATFEVEVDLPHEPTLMVHAFEGEARINVPLIREGNALESNDLRGCLLEEQFANANGILVGDRITVKLNGIKTDLMVRGICVSPEHVITANDVRPTPLTYGFMIVNSAAMPLAAQNEVLVTLEGDADAKTVRAAIEKMYPTALIINHDGDMSTQQINNDIEMYHNISFIFPLLAFAVAALIVLTTLTRMIENQRIQMGTLKALGYSNGAIRWHYLCYAIYPSVIGALLGLLVGRETLPYILWQFEVDTFVMPYQLQAPVSVEQWAVCALAIALSLFICLYTYRKNAQETTASLLRPKPPKAGRKLLLERSQFLWRKLSFNGKMIVRNLFRNKLRTLMSFVGILTCTMLLVTSLGLQDSVVYFVARYFQGTLQYTVRANLTEEAGLAETYEKRIEAEHIDPIMEMSITLHCGDETRTALLTVMDSDQQLLNIGKDETYYRLPEKGIVLTRKLGETMQVKIGDTVKIYLPGDDQPIIETVSDFCDVNIGQGVYMSRLEWASCRKTDFIPTALLVKNPTDVGLQKLNDLNELDALKFPEVQQQQQLEILQSLTGIFSLLSAAALGLAFVVLYNMGILNFAERYREYATLKVLGYHQKEIRSLMRHENDLVAVLGALAGLFPGRWLTATVLRSCEGDNIVFVSTVGWTSYLIAGVITILFSMFVTWLLTRKVKGIDMVEALKSVE